MERAAPGSKDGVPPEPVFRKIRIPFIQRAALVHQGAREELFLIDLALRGVFVERAEALPLGAEVHLSFRLPGNELPIEARCRVAWWRAADMALSSKTLPSGVGLEFVDMDGEGARRIRGYLSEYLRGNPRHRRFHRRPDGEEEDET
jgi:Tfp pilus assembly protein PilZ